MEKKILRRIAEHIAAITIINMMGTVTQDIGLSDDDLDYLQGHLEKIAAKMTVGDLALGTMNDVVDYWSHLSKQPLPINQI